MSNPPVPLHLRILRGNASKRALRAEPEPTCEPECPEPPRFLRGVAADEYWRIAPELHRLGLLTTVDVPSLCAYCVSYARWFQAEEALARMADTPTSGLLIKSVAGDPRANPLLSISRRAAENMLRFAAEFGMTPVARSRLAAGPFGQPPGGSKFSGLLA